jgi:hypothetical protein
LTDNCDFMIDCTREREFSDGSGLSILTRSVMAPSCVIKCDSVLTDCLRKRNDRFELARVYGGDVISDTTLVDSYGLTLRIIIL